MRRGTLRIYLGAAPGVGKTFAMLNEGRRRHEPGHRRRRRLRRDPRPGRTPPSRSATCEVVPRRAIDYRGADVRGDGRRRRRWPAAPTVALVDELAHTNVPGSRHAKRWQDVEELLDAGIDVISTVNIQHLESINDVVERITGVRQRETDARRRRAGRRPDRAGRHDPRGAAPAHGPRQHLRRREGRRRSRPTTSGPATSPPSGSWPCCGWPTGSTTPWRTTASATASPSRGRPASGWSWPSPARPGADDADPAGGPHGDPAPTASCSACTSAPTTGWPAADGARRRPAPAAGGARRDLPRDRGRRRRGRAGRLRPGRERHPARARRQPRAPAGSS